MQSTWALCLLLIHDMASVKLYTFESGMLMHTFNLRPRQEPAGWRPAWAMPGVSDMPRLPCFKQQQRQRQAAAMRFHFKIVPGWRDGSVNGLDLGSVLSSHVVTQNHFQGLSLFWPLYASGTHMVHTYTLGQTLTDINKKHTRNDGKSHLSSGTGFVTFARACLGASCVGVKSARGRHTSGTPS